MSSSSSSTSGPPPLRTKCNYQTLFANIQKNAMLQEKKEKMAVAMTEALSSPTQTVTVTVKPPAPIADDEDAKCAICLEDCDPPTMLDSCQHQFCMECIVAWLMVVKSCPYCRAEVLCITTEGHEPVMLDEDERFARAKRVTTATNGTECTRIGDGGGEDSDDYEYEAPDEFDMISGGYTTPYESSGRSDLRLHLNYNWFMRRFGVRVDDNQLQMWEEQLDPSFECAEEEEDDDEDDDEEEDSGNESDGNSGGECPDHPDSDSDIVVDDDDDATAAESDQEEQEEKEKKRQIKQEEERKERRERLRDEKQRQKEHDRELERKRKAKAKAKGKGKRKSKKYYASDEDDDALVSSSSSSSDNDDDGDDDEDFTVDESTQAAAVVVVEPEDKMAFALPTPAVIVEPETGTRCVSRPRRFLNEEKPYIDIVQALQVVVEDNVDKLRKKAVAQPEKAPDIAAYVPLEEIIESGSSDSDNEALSSGDEDSYDEDFCGGGSGSDSDSSNSSAGGSGSDSDAESSEEEKDKKSRKRKRTSKNKKSKKNEAGVDDDATGEEPPKKKRRKTGRHGVYYSEEFEREALAENSNSGSTDTQ